MLTCKAKEVHTELTDSEGIVRSVNSLVPPMMNLLLW